MYNNNSSKKQLEKSWDAFKESWKNLAKTALCATKVVWNIVKWLYHVVDAADLGIYSKLWDSSNKIIDGVKKNIIKILIPVSILAYSWNKVYQNQKDKKIDDIEFIEDSDVKTVDLKEINYEIQTPDWLKWKKVWDLYSHYLWYNWKSTKIWDTIIVFKPNEILSELYWKKFERKNTKWFTVAKDFYDNIVSKIDFDIVKPSSLDLMTEKIDRTIKEINKNFDWDKFWKERLRWDEKKIKLFKKICNQIDKKCLLAYGMTELMPSPDGNLNKEILDFLLKNWWENFVMNLPAVGDDYTSFWLYQFTSFAVYDVWNTKEWASVMNWYLPKELKIPWSVTKLQWQDHHKAAYLFAMYNLYTLVMKSDWEVTKALELLTNQKDNNDLAQLIAIMHNLPSSWTKFITERYKLRTNQTYINKKIYNKKWKKIYEYDINKNWQIDLYESLLTPSASHNYWKKTYYNRKSL